MSENQKFVAMLSVWYGPDGKEIEQSQEFSLVLPEGIESWQRVTVELWREGGKRDLTGDGANVTVDVPLRTSQTFVRET